MITILNLLCYSSYKQFFLFLSKFMRQKLTTKHNLLSPKDFPEADSNKYILTRGLHLINDYMFFFS